MYFRNERYQKILAAAKLKRTHSFYSWHLMPPAMLLDKRLKYTQIFAKVHQSLNRATIPSGADVWHD